MKWSFPSNNGGDVNGISNAGIETFQGTRIKSLAREICQNSLDARVDQTSPVLVEFSSFDLERSKIPGIDSLQDAFNRGYDFWKCQNSKKAVDFYTEALRLLGGANIPLLRVSDFNTSGLQGSHAEYNSPWCNLTKSSGASDKAGSAGGSFGIGKFAPFACSKFRTVFYSTLDIEGVEAYQGISRITSFKIDTGEITTGVGYYGGDGNTPIYSQFHLDPSFARTAGKPGTDIYIVGFKTNDEWKSDIVASVIDGFLYAIFTEKLVVKVDDITICKDTLAEIIEDYTGTFSEYADKYYEILSNVEEPIVHDFKGMGIVKLWLDIRPDMHRKIAMVRQTGMKIMDRGGISANIPFAGLLYIEGDGINDFLRRLENPQHTKWEPDRYINKQYAQNVIKQLIDFIKDELEKLKQNDNTYEIDPSVGEFLPDDVDDDKSNNSEEETIADKVKTVEKRVSNVTKPIDRGETRRLVDTDDGDIHEETEQGSGSGRNDGTGGDGAGYGDEQGSGTGPHPSDSTKKWISVGAKKIRTLCLNKEQGEYSILFVPAASAVAGTLKLFMAAESQDYPAVITKAMALGQKGIEVEGNTIKNVTFTAGTPIRLKVTIAHKEYCSMEVEANGYKI